MSDNTTPTTQTPPKPEVNVDEIIANSPFATPISVTRNEVTETLKVSLGKRGAWENRPYGHVEVVIDDSKGFEDDNIFMNGLKFIGKLNLRNYLNTILRRVGQDLTDDAVGPDGVFSLDGFIKSWENLAAAGLKLAELRELLDVEQRKHEAYIAGEFMAIITSGDTTAIEEAKALVLSRTSTINALRHEMEVRSARRSKEKETETTMPD